MPDLTLIIIFASLIFLGAGLIGYPLGYAFGRHDARRIYEAALFSAGEAFIYRGRPPQRCRGAVLSAELLTERECEFPSEIDG